MDEVKVVKGKDGIKAEVKTDVATSIAMTAVLVEKISGLAGLSTSTVLDLVAKALDEAKPKVKVKVTVE